MKKTRCGMIIKDCKPPARSPARRRVVKMMTRCEAAHLHLNSEVVGGEGVGGDG